MNWWRPVQKVLSGAVVIIILGAFLLVLYGAWVLASDHWLSTDHDNSRSKDRLPEEIKELSQPREPARLRDKVFKSLAERPRLQVEPLVMERDPTETGELTKRGVIEETNSYREIEGVGRLKESTALNKASSLKLEDMFERQYFDHYDPDGGMAAEALAEEVGYEYLVVGENLAWGNFADDAEVVKAWMDSPGHRENILRDNYTEIGVAVKSGKYRDHQGWMAVQIFGRPQSDCPLPDEELLRKIEVGQRSLETMEEDIVDMNSRLEELGEEEADTNFFEMVDEYNVLVEEYNHLSLEMSTLIDQYNVAVNDFNDCINN